MQKRVVANRVLFDQISQLISEGQEVEIPTKGSSMLPFIVGGKDTLVLGPPSEAPCVGEIVLARLDGGIYVVHRILKVDGETITLMGDGNIRGCEYCSQGDICAKVYKIIHKGRSIDCNSVSEQRRARLWCKLLPLRRYILAVLRRL